MTQKKETKTIGKEANPKPSLKSANPTTNISDGLPIVNTDNTMKTCPSCGHNFTSNRTFRTHCPNCLQLMTMGKPKESKVTKAKYKKKAGKSVPKEKGTTTTTSKTATEPSTTKSPVLPKKQVNKKVPPPTSEKKAPGHPNMPRPKTPSGHKAQQDPPKTVYGRHKLFRVFGK